MSIERDVEKKYIDELERKNKKLKKRKKKRLLIMLLILLLLILAFLLLRFGFGLGTGKGSSGSEAGADSPSSSSEKATTAEAPVFVDVKVSGSSYIYENQVKTLDEIKSTISTMKDNVVIRITDDNATKNAMDDLTKMLDDAKRKISYSSVNNDSSGTDPSSDSSSESEKE
jgi:flagellar basal body-associated protein FliL